MIERRKHPRFKVPYGVEVIHPLCGKIKGRIANMSDSGIFLDRDLTAKTVPELNPDFDHSLKPGQYVEAKIIGRGWDKSLPSLTMKIVRVNGSGIALEFCEPFELSPAQETLLRA